MLDCILNLLFPPKCAFCGKVLSGKARICGDCLPKLPYTANYRCCERCGIPLPGEFSYRLCGRCFPVKRPSAEHVFVPLIYAGAAKRAMLRFKYYMHPSYAEAFAALIAEKMLSYEKPCKPDFITFVPQNKSTHFIRGYNQSELIARRLSEILRIPCVPCLVRKDGIARNATLNASLRRKNVKLGYFPTDKKLDGTALLVDDVLTTGATVFYCASLLRKMGCKKVYCAAALIRCKEVSDLYEEQDKRISTHARD